MPDDETLLAKLAFQFSVQQENVAVEALAHVLTRSSVARAAVADLLALSEAEGLGDLVYRTQAAAVGEGRPDLVGFDAEGRELLLIEAKFWAGLTANQPVAYLERLPVVRGAGLLFVAPAARLPSLWPALVGLCTAAGLMVRRHGETDGDGVSLAALEDGRWLGITSWRHLLDLLIARLDEAGASSAASDARPLAGLCDRMDEEEFLYNSKVVDEHCWHWPTDH